jgi:hypothetical protein
MPKYHLIRFVSGWARLQPPMPGIRAGVRERAYKLGGTLAATLME